MTITQFSVLLYLVCSGVLVADLFIQRNKKEGKPIKSTSVLICFVFGGALFISGLIIALSGFIYHRTRK